MKRETTAAVRAMLEDLGVLRDRRGQARIGRLSLRRLYPGHYQRAAGVWSWMAFLNGVELAGSQHSVGEVLKAYRERRLVVYRGVDGMGLPELVVVVGQPTRNPEDEEFEARAARARSLPKSFGEGWMTDSAVDLVRIAAFAGFNVKELTRRIALRSAHSRSQRINERTVRRVLGELEAEYREAERTA